MFGIFEQLQNIAERLGAVDQAHMYTNGMVTIDVVGVKKNYQICLIVTDKEGKDD